MFTGNRYLDVVKLNNFDKFTAWATENAFELNERLRVEESLRPSIPREFWIPGFCALCGRTTEFWSTFEYGMTSNSGTIIPNYREHLICKYCGFSNRVRASIQMFVQEFRPGVNQPIYITEQLTRTFRWMMGHYSAVSGSEYLPGKSAFGRTVRGIRNEDLQALSWPDGQFDFILSFDVLEHVPDAPACFREMFRCLRRGGRVLFTAPTTLSRYETEVRAALQPSGDVIHFKEPEYHGGNRQDASKGTLCYRYFGWDILRQLEQIGFSNAEMWLYWSRDLGYIGGTQNAIVACKE